MKPMRHRRGVPVLQNTFYHILHSGALLLVGDGTTPDLHEAAPHTPDVHLLRHVPHGNKRLRRHVPRRPAVVLVKLQRLPVQSLRLPEVTQLDVVVEISHQVLGLDVAVDDGRGLRVHVADHGSELRRDLQPRQRGQRDALHVQQIKQVAIGHVLGDDAKNGVLQHTPDVAHDVGVLQRPVCVDFSLQIMHLFFGHRAAFAHVASLHRHFSALVRG
mmetsp:Transcript_11698/g.27867  ORF Transcript_11698/g.27867 Transcript_11698/m.27867 type:complete len:216 (+) Transcript_11698:106-753(+)